MSRRLGFLLALKLRSGCSNKEAEALIPELPHFKRVLFSSNQALVRRQILSGLIHVRQLAGATRERHAAHSGGRVAPPEDIEKAMGWSDDMCRYQSTPKGIVIETLIQAVTPDATEETRRLQRAGVRDYLRLNGLSKE